MQCCRPVTDATESDSPVGARDGAILLVGIFACATSVIFIKESTLHPAMLACLRLVFAAVLLLPVFLRDVGRHRGTVNRGHLMRGLLPGVLLGLHLIVWNVGARMTPAVNASLVVNMVPLVTPALLWMIASERLNRGEWIGTGLGLVGMVALSARDYRFDPAYFAGDAMCFAAMVLFALYIVFARRNKDVPSVFLYVVPLYATAAVTCATACLFVDGATDSVLVPRELALAFGLGVVPTIVGHSALNFAMTRYRGQSVTLANLLQPLFAGILAFLLLGEIPSLAFYGASALILAGAAVSLRGIRESS